MSDDFSPKKNTLRVRTSSDAPQHSLRNAFSKFGKISRIESLTNPQMSLQEVLIEFESQHAAKQALNTLNGTTLDSFHLDITNVTKEQARIFQEINLKKHQQISSQKEEEKSDFKKMEKEIIDDGLEEIINNEFIKEESKSIDVDELLDKYPELKAQIANPQIFKALYDVSKKEYTKKMEQDSSTPQAKIITLSPKQLQEKIKSNKIAKKSGKSPPNPPKRERKISQESYSRSRSRSKSPGISPKRLNLEDSDREIVKKELSSSEKSQHTSIEIEENVVNEKPLQSGVLKDEQNQELEAPRKKFLYSSQMTENKEMNKAFDKNSDYWILGLKMGVYPDMLPNSQKENIKNLILNPKSE